MVTEQQKQSSPEADIHNLAINYFENAGVALFYERGLEVEPLNSKFREVVDEHSANKDKYYSQLLTQVVDRLLTPGEVDFNEIINESIDPTHGSVRYFEEHGGCFSGWLHQLKSDTIDATAIITRTLREDNDRLRDILRTTKGAEQSVVDVLSEKTDPLS